ncbi:Aste57867_19782 [Aphanomyces stellatus]|uniref:Aste57867_19782 protein n=1 Tax=Aphanomyces stellatus TaxID=120398 RepID=A0A485LDE5_9STRA|nr:hypothetical protein As57867_019717 [Aphanomyces stellatus]VFT96480.1 Aste57867_19782 [Aphanomyces stellatus]
MADDDSLLLWGRHALPTFQYTIRNPKHSISHITAIQDLSRTICAADQPEVASHGHLVWDAAVALADYLQAEATALGVSPATRALELGAGIGLVGMALAALGCKEVTLSDQRYCLPLLNMNATTNFTGANEALRPVVRELQWGTDDATTATNGRPMDLVVASDVLYNPSVFPKLVRTIAALASSETVLLMTHEIRNPDNEADFFAQLAAAGFECTRVPFVSTQVDYPDDIVLMRAQRRLRTDDRAPTPMNT